MLFLNIYCSVGYNHNLFIFERIYMHKRMCVENRKMKRFTVSIPKELKARLDARPDVNWPEVIKEGFKEKLSRLEKFEELERQGKLG